MNKLRIREIAEISIIAALYAVLTLALTPLSYGDVQFRISEVLMILIIYKKRYSISMILGCFVANLFSPVGWADIVFGTLATAVSSIPMMFIKNLEISSLFPSIFNGIIVGLELSLVYDLPIPITITTVFLGEFVVVSLLGIPLFRALEKNEGFTKTLDIEPIKSKFNINPLLYLTIANFVIAGIFFFKLSLYDIEGVDNTIYNTLFYNVRNNKNIIISILLLIIPLLFLLNPLKNIKGLIIDIICIIGFILDFIFVCIKSDINPQASFYLFIIIPLFMTLISILKFKWNKDLSNLDME